MDFRLEIPDYEFLATEAEREGVVISDALRKLVREARERREATASEIGRAA